MEARNKVLTATEVKIAYTLAAIAVLMVIVGGLKWKGWEF